MAPLPVLAMLFSVLVPSKGWYAPVQPITLTVKAEQPVTLVLGDFVGRTFDAKGSADISGTQSVDVKQIFPDLNDPGAYLLYAVPKGKGVADFVGTPVVIEVRQAREVGAPPGAVVVRVQPLEYAKVTTDHGAMTFAFYYDSAPATVDNFINLAREGYFDGLTFHRISPGFVLQGGDPRGDGSGGPGYEIEAEFNDRPHEEGALSMARRGDPMEGQGSPPRPEFANSAGTQFFICLDYARTKALDGKYTVWGKVVEGMDTVKALAAVPLVEGTEDTPKVPPVIQKVKIVPVTPGHNPYAQMTSLVAPATQPAK